MLISFVRVAVLSLGLVAQARAAPTPLDCDPILGPIDPLQIAPALPTPLACDEVPAPGASGGDRVFMQSGYVYPPERVQAVISGLVAARRGLVALDGHPLPPTLVLMRAEADALTDAVYLPQLAAVMRRPGEAQVLLLNRNTDRLTPAQLSQLVVDKITFGRAGEMVSTSRTYRQQIYEVPPVGWWLQPFASMVSSAAFPDAGLELTPAYRRPYNAVFPFFEQGDDLAALPFFMVAQKTPGVHMQDLGRLMAQLEPTAPNGQRRLLARWLVEHQPGLLVALAKALVDGRVPRAGDGFLPVFTREKQDHVFAAGDVTVDTGPIRNLAFRLTKVVFERGASYRLELLPTPGVKAFWRPPGVPTWLELNEALPVSGACDGRMSIELLLVAQLASSAELTEPVRLHVTGSPLVTECGCSAGLADPCLVGHWEYDNAAMKEVYTQLTDLGLSWTGTTGKLSVTIDRAGHARFASTAWRHDTRASIEVPDPNGPFVFLQHNTVDGIADMRLGSGPPASRHLCMTPDGTNTMSVKSATTLDDQGTIPVGQATAADVGAFMPRQLEASYSCTREGLAFDMWVKLPDRMLRVPYRFVKVP